MASGPRELGGRVRHVAPGGLLEVEHANAASVDSGGGPRHRGSGERLSALAELPRVRIPPRTAGVLHGPPAPALLRGRRGLLPPLRREPRGRARVALERRGTSGVGRERAALARADRSWREARALGRALEPPVELDLRAELDGDARIARPPSLRRARG